MGDGLVTSRSVLRGSVDLERCDDTAEREDAKSWFGMRDFCLVLISSRMTRLNTGLLHEILSTLR
jgi:hypothetical protein